MQEAKAAVHANAAAAEAAKSPLPDSDASEGEEDVALEEPAAAVPAVAATAVLPVPSLASSAASAWDLSFLQGNQAAGRPAVACLPLCVPVPCAYL